MKAAVEEEKAENNKIEGKKKDRPQVGEMGEEENKLGLSCRKLRLSKS